MKVVLTHGYFLYDDEKELKIMRPYPPLGILYISAFLEKNGVENTIFDATFSAKEKFREYMLKEQPDLIAFYTNLMTKVNIIEAMHWMRSVPELKDTTVVLGGPDVTYNTKDYLSEGASAIVIGEGEETMLELVNAFRNSTAPNLNEISGIAFLENGKVVKTKPRIKIKTVDEIPFPNRKGINLNQYLDTWKKHHGQSAVSISTQRGCPYTCKWCSTAVYGQSYRRRSPKVVVDELEHLVSTYNPDTFWFVDDVFTVSHKWLEAFRDELKQRNVNIKFECISRADRMNEEVIQMLKDAGCFRVWIGAESGSQKIIDAMDRRVDVNQVRDMIIAARKSGIEAGTFIMLGYPGETQTDIEETIHHLKVSNPDHFTITIAYPIKGTGLYEEVEAIQTKNIDWATSTDRDRDFKRTFNRKYYNYAVRRVVNEVNLNKKKLKKEHLSLGGISLALKVRSAKMGMWLQKRKGV
jgi:anaerobic magnesium-protoporphyrin IX monomethyl ester cyclase